MWADNQSRWLIRRCHLPEELFPYVHDVILNGAEPYYTEAEVLKRDGGVRTLTKPCDLLKLIQRAILAHILHRDLCVHDAAHGFVHGHDIVTNALVHTNSRAMLEIDLKDAFWSVRPGYYGTKGIGGRGWHTVGKKRLGLYLDTWDVLIPFVTCWLKRAYCLPQGAPTSPAIFNASMWPVDVRLARLAQNAGGVYTRYADNIVLSVPRPTLDEKVIHAAFRIVTEWGFTVNTSKTRVIHHGNCNSRPLRLPGVNIIDGQLTLPGETVRRFRSALFHAGQRSAHDETARVRCRAIEAYIIRIYGELPPQLRGMYAKGAAMASVLPQDSPADGQTDH